MPIAVRVISTPTHPHNIGVLTDIRNWADAFTSGVEALIVVT